MKYIVMMFGSETELLEQSSPEEIQELIDFMRRLGDDLRQRGELVSTEGLVNADLARCVRFKDGMPVVTDGPFAEAKESLAGYWIVDVDDEARALDIARHIVAFTQGPVEVRKIASGPPQV